MVRNLVLMAGLAAFAAPAFAGGDIWLYVRNNTLLTGKAEHFPSTDREEGVRVFDADMGEDVPNATDDPGLRVLSAAEGDASIAPGTLVSFTVNRALRQWNGTDFSALAPTTLTISFGPASTTSPLTDTPVAGFSVPVDTDGIHDHYDFVLDSVAVLSGVWLLDLTFSISTPGVSPAAPTWIVFAQGVDEATFDAAKDYAVRTIPTPGALALLGLGGLALARRRR